MPLRSEMVRLIRKWLPSRRDPATFFPGHDRDLYLDLRSLTRGLHDVAPHPRLFFMIVLPGSLHIASLAYHLVPLDVRMVVILCNVDSWEENWARTNLKDAWILKLRFRYKHHELLNVLLREIPQPFGIIDFDCFVFRPDYLSGIEAIDERTSAQVFFARHNEVLDLWVPETFLLTLNQPVLSELISRYRVGAGPVAWDELLPAAQQRLATLGLGRNQLPENHKRSFDTLRAILMLGVADGYPLEFIARHCPPKHLADDVFHIGATSDPGKNLQSANRYHMWGSYFWIKRLELFEDSDLRERYLARFGFGNSAGQLSRFPTRPDEDFLEFVDKLAAGKVSEAIRLKDRRNNAHGPE